MSSSRQPLSRCARAGPWALIFLLDGCPWVPMVALRMKSLVMIAMHWNYRRSTMCDDVMFAGTRLKRRSVCAACEWV